MSKLAFLFPGQGSQKPGMLLDIAQQYPQIQATFEQASDALSDDLWAMLQNADAATMSLTANTQPLLLTSGVACGAYGRTTTVSSQKSWPVIRWVNTLRWRVWRDAV